MSGFVLTPFGVAVGRLQASGALDEPVDGADAGHWLFQTIIPTLSYDPAFAKFLDGIAAHVERLKADHAVARDVAELVAVHDALDTNICCRERRNSDAVHWEHCALPTYLARHLR